MQTSNLGMGADRRRADDCEPTASLNQSAPINAVDYGHDQTDDRKQCDHQLDRNGIGFLS